MEPATITSANFTLNGVAASLVYNDTTNTATLTPDAPFTNSTSYTAIVKGGASGVTDLAGNPMAADYTWSFTTASSSGGDTTGPTVTAVLPPNDAPAVSTGTRLSITFDEAMSAATINTNTIELRNASGTLVSAAVTYDGTTNRATVTPSSPLAVSSVYTAVVKGGPDGVKDAANNGMETNFGWGFVTSASSPFGSGPGGPILVVTSTANPFSRYCGEILRAEGLNAFALRDLSSVTASILDQYDVVILGNVALTTNQVTLFTNWVNDGGNLIAMRPDKKLAGLLGLTDLGTTLSEGYLMVDTASGPGAGIVGQTIQFHGAADRYSLGTATALATLYSTATSATANPAVTLRSVGANGGQAAAFTFDLARSVVYTRQGNPAYVGQERDGRTPIRSDDLFYPDYINLDKVAIPQADEQQRLLANMIIRMNADKKPLPRFWYLPDGHEAVVIMTGDDHGNDGTAGRFVAEAASSDPGCTVDDWECVRSSSYIYPDPDGAVTDAEATEFTALGFEIGIHASSFCLDYTADMIETYFSEQMGVWYELFPSLAPPVSHRQHCIAWSGYTVLPEEEEKYGIRLDVNYYYWPPEWNQNRPGFFTGSGMPMRFAALDGSLIDVYQAATQMTDESEQTYPYTIDTLLDRATGDEKYYGVFTANMHTDYATSGDYDAMIASAQARGVPVIAARQMLTWLDGRNGSSFSSIAWDGTTLNFTISRGQGANGLEAMVPIEPGVSVADVTRGGSSIGYWIKPVKGISYVVFSALAGSYSVTISVDTTAPTVLGNSPTQGAIEVSTAADVTVTFSEAMDPASFTSTTFFLNGVDAAVSYNAATNTATLTPTAVLANSTDYTVTVLGSTGGVTDAAGNSLAEDYEWVFTTAAPIVDTTSPTVTSVLPSAGATGVGTGTVVTVAFNEEMAAATINGGSFEMQDAEGLVVAASVTYDPETRTATLLPDVPLESESVYTALVRGGAGGVTDLAGNFLQQNYIWSFTTAAASSGGLVAAYGFEEGSGTAAADESGNGNDGSISGAVWSAAGRFGNALSFNGSSARVNVLDSPSLDLTTAMTLEAWVYPYHPERLAHGDPQRDLETALLTVSTVTTTRPGPQPM